MAFGWHKDGMLELKVSVAQLGQRQAPAELGQGLCCSFKRPVTEGAGPAPMRKPCSALLGAGGAPPQPRL